MESDANYIVVCFIHNRVIDLLTVVGELRLWDFWNVSNFALISHETTMCRDYVLAIPDIFLFIYHIRKIAPIVRWHCYSDCETSACIACRSEVASCYYIQIYKTFMQSL